MNLWMNMCMRSCGVTHSNETFPTVLSFWFKVVYIKIVAMLL